MDIKPTILVAIISSIISLASVYLGQNMSAQNESEKLIRQKLEDIYQRVLHLPDLALKVNSSATNRLNDDNFLFQAAQLNNSIDKYRNEIIQIKAINDLYVNQIEKEVNLLVKCSNTFTNYAGQHFLLKSRNLGKLTPPLKSYVDPSKNLERYESLNAVAFTRLRCEKTGEKVKLAITSAMKDYI